MGKAVSLNGISSEVLKLQTKPILFHLNILLNVIMALGTTPHEMLRVKLVPIPKNRFRDLTSSDNYRCTAVSSCIAKVLESIISCRLKEKLFVSDLQFGFK